MVEEFAKWCRRTRSFRGRSGFGYDDGDDDHYYDDYYECYYDDDDDYYY